MSLNPDARSRLRDDPSLATYVAELEDLREAFQLAPMGLALYAGDGRVTRANARSVQGTVSAGVALIDADCRGSDAVIATADRALSAAKRGGRDRALLG